MCLLISSILTASCTLLIRRAFESLYNLSSVAFQQNLFFAFTKSPNDCIIGLVEYSQPFWFTKPNHDRAPVMSLGTGKSLIAVSFFGEGDIRSGVVSKPTNSMLS